MNARVTLRDLARITGVHFTTVGLALRNDARISASTAARIQAAARAHGYIEDAMLSALSTYRHRNSHRFAGVIAYITTYCPEEMLKTNVTERLMVEAATAHALSRNFQIELFQITAPEMTAERMSRLLWARKIQGIILAPKLPEPGPMENLAWHNFSTVAIGYSVTDLNVHRVCTHGAHNTQLCLAKLRERGYRRIGFILAREIYERSRGNVIGAYLAEQCLQPATDRLAPLFLNIAEITKPRLQQWMREQRPDALVLSSQPLEIYAMLGELGYSIPRDLGVALVARYGKTDHIAGIDERVQSLGEAAVDEVISLIGHNERGLPEYPRYSLVEGRWVDRPTIRAMPAVLEPIQRAS